MTEGEARELLARVDGVGGLDAWIAGQPWSPSRGGWLVLTDLQGWRFRLTVIPDRLRITATAPEGGQPAVWVVSAL